MFILYTQSLLMHCKYFCKLFIFIVGFAITYSAKGQSALENAMSQYYRNPMLWNAGYTGASGNRLFALQNRSWIGFENAPVLTSISSAFNIAKNAAIGASFVNQHTGVLINTYGVFNYAYAIKFTEEKELRLGIALAFRGTRLNPLVYEGQGSLDPTIALFANSKIKFDGNFGAVYRTKNIDLGLSFFRIGDNLRGGDNIVNVSWAQASVQYKMQLGDDEKFQLSPLAMMRLARSTSAVFDFGAQFEYNKVFNTMLVYQTTGNIRAGAGFAMGKLGEANFYYSTNRKIANNASQQYEFCIGFYLGDAKK